MTSNDRSTSPWVMAPIGAETHWNTLLPTVVHGIYQHQGLGPVRHGEKTSQCVGKNKDNIGRYRESMRGPKCTGLVSMKFPIILVLCLLSDISLQPILGHWGYWAATKTKRLFVPLLIPNNMTHELGVINPCMENWKQLKPARLVENIMSRKSMCFPNKSIFPVPVKCHRMLRVVVTFTPTNSKKEVLKPTNTFNINVFKFNTTILEINPPSKEMIAVCSNTSGDSCITQ